MTLNSSSERCSYNRIYRLSVQTKAYFAIRVELLNDLELFLSNCAGSCVAKKVNIPKMTVFSPTTVITCIFLFLEVEINPKILNYIILHLTLICF